MVNVFIMFTPYHFFYPLTFISSLFITKESKIIKFSSSFHFNSLCLNRRLLFACTMMASSLQKTGRESKVSTPASRRKMRLKLAGSDLASSPFFTLRVSSHAQRRCKEKDIQCVEKHPLRNRLCLSFLLKLALYFYGSCRFHLLAFC